LRSHPAPSFEADTFAFALIENDLVLNRILKLLDPQCIVTIGDKPSFTNPLAAPYYICRKWIQWTARRPARGLVHGCRRRPYHPLERKRLGSDEVEAAARSVVYDHYNIEHGENWEPMESVAGLYNRLVIWDPALFHLATNYDHFTADGSASSRPVQLFFFDI
jgi:hypothetical protein